MRRMSRLKKKKLYNQKYGNIPLDEDGRINMLQSKLKNKELNRLKSVIDDYNTQQVGYLKIVLYEEPEGALRPRFTSVGDSMRVYSPNAKSDNLYMRELTNREIGDLKNIIQTPCSVTIDAYFKTPKSFNNFDRYLAECKYIRPITKPDWDNIGKKYCDMLNGNIWYDDSLLTNGTVNRYYSILPRVEIYISYLYKAFNRYQANQINAKALTDFKIDYIGNEKER